MKPDISVMPSVFYNKWSNINIFIKVDLSVFLQVYINKKHNRIIFKKSCTFNNHKPFLELLTDLAYNVIILLQAGGKYFLSIYSSYLKVKGKRLQQSLICVRQLYTQSCAVQVTGYA